MGWFPALLLGIAAYFVSWPKDEYIPEPSEEDIELEKAILSKEKTNLD